MSASLRRAAAAAVLAVTGAMAAPLAAQAPRTVELSRQIRDSQPLQVHVEHVAGRVALQPATGNMLYQMQLAYDPRAAEPVHAYDATASALRLGVRRVGREWRGGDAPVLRIELARAVPLDLRLDMGAAEAALDLGGLRLSRVHLTSGASDATVQFGSPNLMAMELLELDVGAASLRARGLGNARARDVRVRVGVGSADLDFSGRWEGEMSLDLSVHLGRTTLRVPEEVGVRVELSRVATSFDLPGFTRRGDAWYSDNWDMTTNRLTVRGRTALGRVVVERIG